MGLSDGAFCWGQGDTDAGAMRGAGRHSAGGSARQSHLGPSDRPAMPTLALETRPP